MCIKILKLKINSNAKTSQFEVELNPEVIENIKNKSKNDEELEGFFKNYKIYRKNPIIMHAKLSDEKISAHDSDWDIKYKKNQWLNPISEASKILIILESPHKDEYFPVLKKGEELSDRKIKVNESRAANGKTGTQISLGIINLIYPYLKKHNINEFQVYVLNMVPYPASLFPFTDKIIKHIKEEVWNAIWSIEDVQKEFYDEIQRLEPELIIDATTKFIKEGKYIDFEKLGNFIKFNVTHPSSWNIPKLKTDIY